MAIIDTNVVTPNPQNTRSLQHQNQTLILDHISKVLDATADTHAAKLTQLLDTAGRIFVSGAGRSRLVGSFFAMRLMHAGYGVSMVGEIVTPSVRRGDLLLVISGSGETEQLIAFTQRAKSIGAIVVLVSSRQASTIADLADCVLQIGGEVDFEAVKGMPMGTIFELSALCFLEALIAHLIWEKDLPEEEMKSRHANLE